MATQRRGGGGGGGGKTAIVTGANTGLGLETVRQLAATGSFGLVVLACRSEAKGAAAVASLEGGAGACRLLCLPLDLSSLASVRAFARAALAGAASLDVLVCNAGCNAASTASGLTGDGLEFIFQVNYLGHALLAALLRPALERAPAARVVSVSSVMHRLGETDYAAAARTPHFRTSYRTSKLAQVHFTLEFNRRARAEGSRVLALAVTPGAVNSDIWRHERGLAAAVCPAVRRLLFLTPAQGAVPSVMAATTHAPRRDELVPYLAPYYIPDACPWPFCVVGPFRPGPAEVSRDGRDRAAAAALWDLTRALLDERDALAPL